MRAARNALHIAVREDDRKGERRELQREPIEHRGAEEKDRRGDDGERNNEAARDVTGRDRTRCRPRIYSIDLRIREAIERHRRGACADHTDDNPAEHVQRWPSTRSQYSAGESKWKRKDRVLPLDHLERHARAVQNRAHPNNNATRRR
jgi:hypothetical protein